MTQSYRDNAFRATARDHYNIYGENGKFSFHGWCRMVWEKFHYPSKCLAALAVTGVAWGYTSRWVCQSHNDAVQKLYSEGETNLRASGTPIRSEAHLARSGQSMHDDTPCPRPTAIPRSMIRNPKVDEKFIPRGEEGALGRIDRD